MKKYYKITYTNIEHNNNAEDAKMAAYIVFNNVAYTHDTYYKNGERRLTNTIFFEGFSEKNEYIVGLLKLVPDEILGTWNPEEFGEHINNSLLPVDEIAFHVFDNISDTEAKMYELMKIGGIWQGIWGLEICESMFECGNSTLTISSMPNNKTQKISKFIDNQLAAFSIPPDTKQRQTLDTLNLERRDLIESAEQIVQIFNDIIVEP